MPKIKDDVTKKKKVTLIIQEEFLQKIKTFTLEQDIVAKDVMDKALGDYLKDKRIKPVPLKPKK